MIYRIRRDEIEALDVLENVAEGLYRPDSFRVLGEDGAWHIADLYRVARPTGPFPPSDAYLDLMIGGAIEHGLPDDYVAMLRSLRT